MTTLRVRAVAGLPRLAAGDDLAGLVLDALGPEGLSDGDVLCVSSKAVAKVEGRTRVADRDAVVDDETDRVVARRGTLRVVRTRHGLVLAAAGVDASNTEAGTVVPLPVDPDASARALRAAVHGRAGRNAAVVVTDTVGRAWRDGQTDLAVGCAGLPPLLDLAGEHDAFGTVLEVTAPAVADEVAGAAELVLAKDGLTPVAVVSGLAHLVLAAGDDGPGAVALVRPEGDDLFGLGAADAVTAAVRRDAGDARGFATGRPDVDELVAAAAAPFGDELRVAVQPGTVEAAGDPYAAGAFGERLRVLCWAVGIDVETGAADPADRAWVWTLRGRT